MDEKHQNALLLGKNCQDIDTHSFEQPVHAQIVPALRELRDQAAMSGFDLRLVSAYRSFDQQLAIWNAKAVGKRPILDDNEREIGIEGLAATELVFAILRWSALPGASRHHWGTDFDVYDASALSTGQTFELKASETRSGGVFADFYRWLDDCLASGRLPFHRPYARDRGGVAPEPWHLSYSPLSEMFFNQYDIDLLEELIVHSDIALKPSILENLQQIYRRFIVNVEPSGFIA